MTAGEPIDCRNCPYIHQQTYQILPDNTGIIAALSDRVKAVEQRCADLECKIRVDVDPAIEQAMQSRPVPSEPDEDAELQAIAEKRMTNASIGEGATQEELMQKYGITENDLSALEQSRPVPSEPDDNAHANHVSGTLYGLRMALDVVTNNRDAPEGPKGDK